MKCVNETLPVASFSIYSVCHVFGEFNREIGGNLQNILIHLKPESNMNPVPKKSFFLTYNTHGVFYLQILKIFLPREYFPFQGNSMIQMT